MAAPLPWGAFISIAAHGKARGRILLGFVLFWFVLFDLMDGAAASEMCRFSVLLGFVLFWFVLFDLTGSSSAT